MLARVYLPTATANTEYLLDATKSHHLIKVLRLNVGATITAFDGVGHAYVALIKETSKRSVKLITGEQLPNTKADMGVSVHIGQVVSTPAKMDWIVEKATELGVSRITPLIQTGARISEHHVKRWQRLVIAASEQCGRTIIPLLSPLCPLSEWNEVLPPEGGLRILLSPRAKRPLISYLSPPLPAPIILLIGAESGFSAQQEEQWQAAHFQPAHLGARILRTETAALAALAIIHSGDEQAK